MSAAARLAQARRCLVVGIGGGGDVVGALAFGLAAADAYGVEFIPGGLTWERRVVDPLPGPRRLDEIASAERLNEGVALAGPDTSGPGDFRFCEARMAEFLGAPVALIDPNLGPRRTAAALDDGAEQLGCDHVILLDVGGDVLAHGDEPGLASPLADAVLLAAAAHMRTPTTGCVFGAGCDGELEPSEVMERVRELEACFDVALGAAAIERAFAATATVVTEASAMALRCARGETGIVEIRRGLRTVTLTADGGRLICFDPAHALDGPALLANAVIEARDLLHANDILMARGVTTELELERGWAAAARSEVQNRAR